MPSHCNRKRCCKRLQIPRPCLDSYRVPQPCFLPFPRPPGLHLPSCSHHRAPCLTLPPQQPNTPPSTMYSPFCQHRPFCTEDHMTSSRCCWEDLPCINTDKCHVKTNQDNFSPALTKSCQEQCVGPSSFQLTPNNNISGMNMIFPNENKLSVPYGPDAIEEDQPCVCSNAVEPNKEMTSAPDPEVTATRTDIKFKECFCSNKEFLKVSMADKDVAKQDMGSFIEMKDQKTSTSDLLNKQSFMDKNHQVSFDEHTIVAPNKTLEENTDETCRRTCAISSAKQHSEAPSNSAFLSVSRQAPAKACCERMPRPTENQTKTVCFRDPTENLIAGGITDHHQCVTDRFEEVREDLMANNFQGRQLEPCPPCLQAEREYPSCGKTVQTEIISVVSVDASSSCVCSHDSIVEAKPQCSCHYPPAFKQFSCTGNINGNCSCARID